MARAAGGEGSTGRTDAEQQQRGGGDLERQSDHVPILPTLVATFHFRIAP
jgi:hypothetical protein